MISVHFQGKPFDIRVIQVDASNAEEAEVEWFCEDLQDILEHAKKRCRFHYRELECKSRPRGCTWTKSKASSKYHCPYCSLATYSTLPHHSILFGNYVFISSAHFVDVHCMC